MFRNQIFRYIETKMRNCETLTYEDLQFIEKFSEKQKQYLIEKYIFKNKYNNEYL